MQLHVSDGFGQAPGATATGPRPPLGFIVPNHALRRTAYQVAARTPGVRIIAGAQVHRVAALATHAEVDFALTTPPGQPSERLCAPLVVAADSRFSAARRQLGIGAQMTDFGRTVIVCRMRHTPCPMATPPTSALATSARWPCYRCPMPSMAATRSAPWW